MPNAARIHREPYRFEHERSLLNRWHRRCLSQDAAQARDLTGLSPAGSPPTHMKALYEQDPTPDPYAEDYKRELPDPELEQVDEFMAWCEVLFPAAHRALLARHRQLINGVRVGDLPEGMKAQRLYFLPRANAAYQLVQDCEVGYAALQRWLRSWRKRERL